MQKRPFELYILCLLLLFIAVGALYGGGALILKPDGSLLGMQLWLGKIHFPDFLLPGIILLVFNGLLPLLVVAGLLFKPDCKFANALNLYKDKHWAWAYSVYSGIIMLLWIIIQQFLTDFFVLQPIVALGGLLIVVFTLTPRVMAYCRK